MLSVKRMNVVYRRAKRHKSGDDCARTRAKDQVEALIKRPSEHGFDFLEDSQGIEAFSTAAIQRQNPTSAGRGGGLWFRIHMYSRSLRFVTVLSGHVTSIPPSSDLEVLPGGSGAPAAIASAALTARTSALHPT